MIWHFKTHLWSVIIRDTELLDVYSEYEHREFESIADARFCQSLSPTFLRNAFWGSSACWFTPLPAPSRKPCQLGHGICGWEAGFVLREKTFQPAKNFAVLLSKERALHSCVQLFMTHELYPPGSLSVEFFRQEYWSGLPLPPPGGLPDPGIEPASSALQADSLPSEPPGKPK